VDELRVTFEGRSYRFRPPGPVQVGRSPDSDVVVADPTVSRQHLCLTWSPGGWVVESLGRSGTYRQGQAVTTLAVTEPVELSLATPQGPLVLVEPTERDGMARAAEGGEPARFPPAGERPVHATDREGPAHATEREGPAHATEREGPAHAALSHAASVAAEGADELATAFRILVPVSSWLTSPGWRQGLRLLVIAYALLPLIFLAVFASSANLAAPGWAYSLYIAPLWAIVFWLLIRPGPIGRLEVLAGAGITVWVLAWITLVTGPVDARFAAARFSVADALGIGFNEEITKALPVLAAALGLLWLRSVKLDVRMWMFLGTVAGLVFGVREQAGYTDRAIKITTQLGLARALRRITPAQADNLAVREVLSFAERVFVDGFQHAVWAGMAAFFIGMAVNYPRRRLPLILTGITIAASLHALNDWILTATGSLWPWIAVQALSLLAFLGYTMSAATIERNVRQTPLFRGDSLLMERVREPGG
jgi:RsiW-degrading membrane proteinase PrsW (M82 family)